MDGMRWTGLEGMDGWMHVWMSAWMGSDGYGMIWDTWGEMG